MGNASPDMEFWYAISDGEEEAMLQKASYEAMKNASQQ